MKAIKATTIMTTIMIICVILIALATLFISGKINKELCLNLQEVQRLKGPTYHPTKNPSIKRKGKIVSTPLSQQCTHVFTNRMYRQTGHSQVGHVNLLEWSDGDFMTHSSASFHSASNCTYALEDIGLWTVTELGHRVIYRDELHFDLKDEFRPGLNTNATIKPMSGLYGG